MRKRLGVAAAMALVAAALVVGSYDSAAQERAGARGAFPRPEGPGPAFIPPRAFVEMADRNQDGRVTKDEVAEWYWERLVRADADKDGALTRQEMDALTPGPREGGPGRRGGFEGRPPQGRPDVPADAGALSSSPQAKSDEEKKILAVLEDMDRNQRGGNMNVPVADGRLLRLLTEALGAKHVVELGTSNGYSGIWFALALRTTGGKLTTHEIDARRANMARENFKRAGVSDLITLVEGDAHQTVTRIKEPIDLVFLDADKEGYIDYLEKLLPLVRPGGLIVAHNITPRMADPKYIQAITTNPNLETHFLYGSGVSVTMKKR